MNKENNNEHQNDGDSSGNASPPARGGWSHPWGYNLPCFRPADSTQAHQCNATAQHGNFLVNEKATHFD